MKGYMHKLLLSLSFLFFTSILYGQQNLELLSNLAYEDGLSDIWGYVDSTDIEYALVAVKGPAGGQGGVSVVSLEDAENPEEVFFASGTRSTWRDIKEYDGYAYITTEAADGLMIINLNSLPDTSGLSVDYYFDNRWITAHNLFIDENGIMYVFGAGTDSLGTDGVLMYDVTIDPIEPEFVGEYNEFYVHDGMARGDTLYIANVYQGTFAILDVADKENPIYLGGAETPDSFTHNVWVSDDGDHLYTTDEKENAFIASYSISDLDDIEEKDRVKIYPGSNTIVHNVHFLDEYLITSYYKAGVTIHDVSDPENMILVGHYDTSPTSGGGFDGAWGVYPFLPSGKIIASDISEGLFVFEPSYIRAARLEGQITDAANSNPIFGARVEILDAEYEAMDESNVLGNYKTGLAEEGFFDVVVSKYGYFDVLVEDVELINGQVTILNVSLEADISIGMEELDDKSFTIYPNPIKDALNINVEGMEEFEDVDLMITDLSGKEMYSEKLYSNSNRVFIGNSLDNGIYIMRLYDGESMLYRTKIFISK